jgi:hypothetical protein
MPKTKSLKPTHNNVLKILDDLEILVKIKTEAQAEDIVSEYLEESFDIVARQYHLEGFRGQKIDIDIGRGSVGVEVKLAKSLLENIGEVYRCIGQAVVYLDKQYKDNLILVIVGTEKEIHHHEIDEITDILSDLGVSCIFTECP